MGSGGDHYLMSATNRTKKGSPTSWVWGELDCATDTTPSGSSTSWDWIPRIESVTDVPTGTEDSWDWTEADCLIPSVDFTITVNCGVGGVITPAGPTVTVAAYSDKTFTITKNTGYNISSVLIDGFNEGAISSYTFTNIIANHSIAATFAIKTYTVTATAGANGTIDPPGVTTVNYGGSVHLHIIPNPTYTVSNVIINGVSVGATSSYTFLNISSNHTISATFSGGSVPTYTITASAGGGGTITPSGTITVYEHTSKSFYTTANENYEIAYMKIDGIDYPAISTYVFSDIVANHTITAYFQIIVIPPPIHTETRYFTADTAIPYESLHEDNTSYSAHGEYWIEQAIDDSVLWGVRVYVRTSGGVETEITSGVTATVFRSAANANYGIQSATLSVAQVLVSSTDRIVVKVYATMASGSWKLLGVGWNTGALSAGKILANTWTIYYTTRRGYSGGITYAYFAYGDIYQSRITGFKWQEPAP